MANSIDRERAIRVIVSNAVRSYASGFSMRHLAEVDNENGVINMKIHNVFIAALGSEIQYCSALARSLDSSLGNMLEGIAISIAKLNYTVSQHVEGTLYKEQTDYIAELLEQYKRDINRRKPRLQDYQGISQKTGTAETKRHESDYYLIDEETGMHYLIGLTIGGGLDNKKVSSEKTSLLEQYCILANNFESEENIKIHFASVYNGFGRKCNLLEEERMRHFFADDELLTNDNFLNLVCKSERGYEIVLDEYHRVCEETIRELS